MLLTTGNLLFNIAPAGIGNNIQISTGTGEKDSDYDTGKSPG